MRYRNPPFAPEYTGRKPSVNDMGAIRLNPYHRANENLVAEWLFNERAGVIHNVCRPSVDTFGGAPTWVSESVGPALSFDATDDQVNAQAIYNLGATYSISITIKLSALSYVNDWFRYAAQYPSVYAWLSNFYDTNLLARITGTDYNAASCQAPVSGLGWHNVVFINTGSTITLYCDGKAGSPTNHSLTTTGDGSIVIGGGYENRISNIVSNVKIWKRVLSPIEIVDLHVNPFGTPSNPRLIMEPRRTWFVPAAAPGGWKPYWATRNQQIHGGGIV